MKIIVLIFYLLASFSACAATVTWQFSTVMDGSKHGGTRDMPLSVVYTFDTSQPGGFEPESESTSVFGPVTVRITLGAETVIATGAQIILTDNSGTHVEGFPARTDTYELNANGAAIAGDILGMEIGGFMFLLFDNDQNMFAGKPAYPQTPDFAALGDYQLTAFYPTGQAALLAPLAAPYSLTVVPEPGVLLLTASFCGFTVMRRRRSGSAGKQGHRMDYPQEF